jgi:nitroreductase
MSTSIYDISALLGTIQTRRSFALNQLSPEPIDLGAVQLMLEAANWAPNHGSTEPWRFSVFAGDGRQGLSDAFGAAYRQLTPDDRYQAAAEQAQRDRVWQAPVWISLGMLPALNERGAPRMPEWEELIAVGCAAHNAHLVAATLGLGAKWTSGAIVTHPHVAQFVGLEQRARLLGFLYVGRPAVAWPEGRRRALDEKVHWVTGEPEGAYQD